MGYMGAAGKFSNIVILDMNGKAIVSYRPEVMGLELGEADYFQRIVDHRDPGYVHVSKVHASLQSRKTQKQLCRRQQSPLF